MGKTWVAKQCRKGQELLLPASVGEKVWIYLYVHICLVWLPGEVLISSPAASFL